MSAIQCFVGIDVAKAQRDMAVRPSGARWAVAHDDPGIMALVARLQAVQPTLLVLAATGGSQRAGVAALAAASLPVVVVTPGRSGMLPKPQGSWPQPMPSPPAPWPIVPRRCAPPRAPCPIRRPKSCAPWWRGAAN